MSCGETCVKYILFLVNLMFAIGGLALIGLGVAVHVRYAVALELLETYNIHLGAITTIVVGCIVFFIAFLGCCGSIKENNCMLVTYSVFMILLMIVKVILAILVFVYLQRILDEIPKILEDIFKSDNPAPFHAFETAAKCCGMNGVTDYTSAIPVTCCADTATTCTVANAYTTGCTAVMQNFINSFGFTIGLVLIAIAAIELVGIVFALCLANHARNKYRRSRY